MIEGKSLGCANFCVLNGVQGKGAISFLSREDKLLTNFKIVKSLSDQSECSDKNHVILANSGGTPPNLFVLANMVVDFAFDEEAWVTFEERDLCEGMHGVLEGWFPEFRFSKKIDDISARFRSDPLAD